MNNNTKLKKILIIIISVIFLLDSSLVFADNIRTKSKVLVIINNIANTKNDKALNKIMDDEIHKKIKEIYIEEDNEKYVREFQGHSNSMLNLNEILDKIKTSDSDYFIYAELKAIDKESNFNFVYYDKEVTATFYIRILDIKNRTELYASEYSIMAQDSTDYFFIGSASVAKKALQKVMFRAGEAISTYLPL